MLRINRLLNWKKTGNFRTYLYFFDQIRSNILKQLGSLPRIFSVHNVPDEPEVVQSRSLSKKRIYRDLKIKFRRCGKHGLRKTRTDALNILEVKEKRLNYLLALNGWTIDEEISVESEDKNMLKIKRDFLKLVHNEGVIYTPRMVKHVKENEENKNVLFSSKSLVLLKNKIQVILQNQIDDVRILEHVFLQPVWDRSEDFDFDGTVFLFLKKGKKLPISHRMYGKYVRKLVRGFVPAHIVMHVVWCTEKDKNVEILDRILNAAYPPSEIFYFDREITENQRIAMNLLMNKWINKTPSSNA